jgi:hypothetical protein
MDVRLEGYTNGGEPDTVTQVVVSLSRRNLETLVEQQRQGDMLDMPLSRLAQLARKTPSGNLIVYVEPDEVHYGSPRRLAQTGGAYGIGPEDIR